MVDDFGMKYVGEEHVQHLIQTSKKTYKISTNWTGRKYSVITLDWNYDNWKVICQCQGTAAKPW
jgi:hypothetical protein